MSRIFGIFSSDAALSPELRESVVDALKTPSCIAHQVGTCDAGTMISTGWRHPEVANTAQCLAVVDGYFYAIEGGYNGAEAKQSSAQVLISLYRQFGFAEALSRINGDFAVALYDFQTDTLWVGRDRFGARPLFYTRVPGGIAFASRPRALLQLPGVSREPNQRFVAAFAGLHYRYFDNEPAQSPYAAIEQLPAAHYLQLRNGQVSTQSYWQFEEHPDWDDSFETLAERYRDLLLDAVRIRLAAADRPAFTLSGGMDSSSVLASAVHVSGKKQAAISTVYEDKTYDESDDIRTILADTVDPWHPISVGNPDVFSIVRQMVATNDEPVATATWLSHFLLCKQTRELGYRSLFGGLGGDELNAGEYEYFIFHFADLKRLGMFDQLDLEIEKWAAYHDHPIYRKNRETAMASIDRLVDLNRPGFCRLDRTRYEKYLSAIGPRYRETVSTEPVMEHPYHDYLKNRTFQDITRETAPCCLRAEDRHTVHFGLDNFLPFFDHRLVEFMFRVPGNLKIHHGVTKYLMRHAMRGILPDETRNRITKTGWNAPAHQWFSQDRSEPLFDLIRSQRFRERGLYDVHRVETLLNEHHDVVMSGRAQENHMMFFWQLVNVELWLQSVESDSQNRSAKRAAIPT